MEIPTEFPVADPHTNAELQGNLLRDYEYEFEQVPEDQNLSKLCSDAGLRIVEKGKFLFTLRSIPSERVDSRKHENRPGLGCEGLPSSKTLRYRNHGRIPVS